MEKPCVLIVDDDPTILKLLEVNFDMEGFDTILARDGSEALKAALEFNPDVIVSDVMMPEMSGLELAERLKADDVTKDIPLLLLSAKAQRDDIAAGLAAGADDYLTKPFEPLELVDRVNELLRRLS